MLGFQSVSTDPVSALPDDVVPPTPTIPPVTGGHGYLIGNRFRTPAEITESRRRFGIEPKEAAIIENVAARQIADTRLDNAQKIQELQGEMRLAGLEMQTRHLEALAEERNRLLNAEIARLMRLGMDNDAALLMIMLAAAQ